MSKLDRARILISDSHFYERHKHVKATYHFKRLFLFLAV
ncbi:hypothetical protein J504_1909 [Acinetobacter baumannii 348935]|nr:hypothetical protein J504_1909 [Acinetobacter baumannii 348935]